MPSSRRRGRRMLAAPGRASLALALALAGCAGGDFTRQRAPLIAPEQATTSQAGKLGAEKAPADATTAKTAEPAAAMSGDLWQRIREGFALPSEADRQAVRQWVQFYAGRREHLENAAENAKPFLWHVVEAADARDLPLELALLPIVESGYDPTAYSYAHASGMWQFMPYTARRFGLREDWWHDGRRDVLRSTEAAMDYLEWLHRRYGDWLLALAAYNAGEGRVDRALERSPEDVFWALELPPQTENYVPKLLALKRLLLEPQRFDFEWPGVPDEPVTVPVELPGQVELAIAADMMGMSRDALQRINPGVRRWATHPDGPHRLLVPSDRVDRLRSALDGRAPDSLVTWRRHRVRQGEALGTIAERYGTRVAVLQEVNELNGSLIRAGQHLLIPVGGKAGTSPPPARDVSPAPDHYTVASGDSLWQIARRFDVGVDDLRRWNGLAPGAVLRPGQRLAIRAGTGRRTYRVQSGDSLWTIARRFGVGVAQLRAWNGLPEGAVLRPGQTLTVPGGNNASGYYRVQHGDSLWSIASRFRVAVEDLKAWNDMADSTIRPGQRLRVAAR